MRYQPRIIAHVFNLNNTDDFKKAEAFKAKLENGGYTVTTQPHGLSGVRITGARE